MGALMTSIGRILSRIISRRKPEGRPIYVGRIDRERSERHARSPGVQAMTQKARESWRERYGVDPAAGHLERQA